MSEGETKISYYLILFVLIAIVQCIDSTVNYIGPRESWIDELMRGKLIYDPNDPRLKRLHRHLHPPSKTHRRSHVRILKLVYTFAISFFLSHTHSHGHIRGWFVFLQLFISSRCSFHVVNDSTCSILTSLAAFVQGKQNTAFSFRLLGLHPAATNFDLCPFLPMPCWPVSTAQCC